MLAGNNNGTSSEKKRSIDNMAEKTYSWWARSFVLVTKIKVKTWKAVILVAFAAGFVAALIWSASRGG